MSEQIDLKPCPFCGGMARLLVLEDGVRVACTECECQTKANGDLDPLHELEVWKDPYYTTAVETAVEGWNRRKCKLTDDDIETIRIHISAFKGELSKQHRWEDAQEYDDLINRLMSAKNK